MRFTPEAGGWLERSVLTREAGYIFRCPPTSRHLSSPSARANLSRERTRQSPEYIRRVSSMLTLPDHCKSYESHCRRRSIRRQRSPRTCARNPRLQSQQSLLHKDRCHRLCATRLEKTDDSRCSPPSWRTLLWTTRTF